MKTVDFARAGMITDIPRSLSGASVAVRNIFFPYHFVRNTQQRGGEVVGAGEDGRKTSAAGLLSIDEAPQEVRFMVPLAHAHKVLWVLDICCNI